MAVSDDDHLAAQLERLDALLRHAPSDARALLLQLLGDRLGDVRSQAAAAAARVPVSGDLVERLAECAEDPEEPVRRAALVSLGEVVRLGELAGARSADYAPSEAAGDPEAEAFRRAEACLRERVLGEGAPLGERALALLGLAALGPEEGQVMAGIAELLAAEESEARRLGLLAAGRSGARARFSGSVAAALAGRDPSLAFEAAQAAGALGVANCLGELTTLLADDDAPQPAREAAATALGRLLAGQDDPGEQAPPPTQAAVAALLAAAQDPEPTLARAARLALGQLPLNPSGGSP